MSLRMGFFLKFTTENDEIGIFVYKEKYVKKNNNNEIYKNEMQRPLVNILSSLRLDSITNHGLRTMINYLKVYTLCKK